MKKTSMTTTSPAYSISAEDQISIDVWTHEPTRPSILIHAPVHDVGEHELIEELSEASYRLQGFHDARRRHFISRRYPHSLSDIAYARFCDQAFDVSEIADAFRGVDCIDLSDWLGHRNLCEDAQWQRFVSYLQSHPETDFVFLVYGKATDASNLALSISSSSGNAVLPIGIDYPSPEQLANRFVAHDPTLFAGYRDDIATRLTEMVDDDRHASYSTIRAAATTAIHSTPIKPDIRQAIIDALEQAVERPARHTFNVGFTGGER